MAATRRQTFDEITEKQIERENKNLGFADSKRIKPNGGCLIKTSTAFVLVLLAVLSIVGVGVIMAFVGPRTNATTG